MRLLKRFLMVGMMAALPPAWAAWPQSIDGQTMPSLAPMLKKATPAVVNVSTKDLETDLQLQGVRIRPNATAIVLASDRPEDENTLDQPTKVKPVTSKLDNASATFCHTFPANSVTVLRLKLQ